MGYFELTAENLNTSVSEYEILIIDFWASWCRPCMTFGPIFEQVSEEYPNVGFGKCDTEKEREVAGRFGIRSIPTIAIFKDQVLIYKEGGGLSKESFKALVESAIALDMSTVGTDNED